MRKFFHSKFLVKIILVLPFLIMVPSFSFAVITSNDEISSKYEIVGVISDNVVVLKDKNTGTSLTRREGELLSQELKISKINADSVILTDSSGLGQKFVLLFDKFGTSAKAREENSRNMAKSSAPSYYESGKGGPSSSKDGSNSNDSSKSSSSSVSELSQETLDLLDKFYEDPDSFSPEQIKDLERRLIDGL